MVRPKLNRKPPVSLHITPSKKDKKESNSTPSPSPPGRSSEGRTKTTGVSASNVASSEDSAVPSVPGVIQVDKDAPVGTPEESKASPEEAQALEESPAEISSPVEHGMFTNDTGIEKSSIIDVQPLPEGNIQVIYSRVHRGTIQFLF